jgi:hypothetical protein
MKASTSNQNLPSKKTVELPAFKQDEEQKTASGRDRWTAVQRVRLPHKVGLPLSSSGCGDAIER